MKILINTASTYKGGGIQVAKSFIEESVIFSNYHFYVVLSKTLSTSINIDNFPNNFQFEIAPFRPATKYFKIESHNKFLKKTESFWKPDVVFTTSGPAYWKPNVPHVVGFNLGHYIYSDSPYFKEISLKKRFYWLAMKYFAIYRFKTEADALLVQTNDVNTRVKRIFGIKKVFTIFNTVSSYYVYPKVVKPKITKTDNNEFRLITLSAWYPHKNLQIILKVLSELKLRAYNSIKFIVTLPEDDFQKLKGNNHNKNLVNVGTINVDEGASLYQECDALFLPTLLECFSASYAEAMVMQKPILTSDLSFAHTVCGDAAVYFDPMNPKDIASKIIEVYENKELQRDLISKGKKQLKNFGTAKDRAAKVLEICKRAIENEK